MNIEEYLKICERQKGYIEDLKCSIGILKLTNHVNDKKVELKKTPLGILRYVFRRLVRKSISWFTRPYWEQQNLYNMQVVKTLDTLIENSEGFARGVTEWIASSEELTIEDAERLRTVFRKEDEEEQSEGKLRVFQIVSTLNFGDAVGNDVMAIRRALMEGGYETAIFTGNIHPKIPINTAYPIAAMPQLYSKDILIYHFAAGDPLAEYVRTLPCCKVMRYHNVTPPGFFKPYDRNAAKISALGLKQLKALKRDIDYGMVDSAYNKSDLQEAGYCCPIDVVPVLIPFSDYEQTPDEKVVKKYQDDWVNIVFVGRVAPNKRIEDVISGYAAYKEKYNAKSRLFLVGNYKEEDAYYQKLAKKVFEEDIRDVVFTGHISFAAILAYYVVADVFLCMSEHEGFCVPLLEAMYFNVPIIAYNSTAVPDTLGNAGILLDRKEPEYVASKIDEMLSSEELKKKYVDLGMERLKDFQYDVIKKQIIDCIKGYQGDLESK